MWLSGLVEMFAATVWTMLSLRNQNEPSKDKLRDSKQTPWLQL